MSTEDGLRTRCCSSSSSRSASAAAAARSVRAACDTLVVPREYSGSTPSVRGGCPLSTARVPLPMRPWVAIEECPRTCTTDVSARAAASAVCRGSGTPGGTSGYSKSTHRALTGYSRGTHRVLTGYSQGTHGVLTDALRFVVWGWVEGRLSGCSFDCLFVCLFVDRRYGGRNPTT